MRPYNQKIIGMLLLAQLLLNCTFHDGKKSNQNEGIGSGKALVDHLDELFTSLESKNANEADFQQSMVTINENIRQTIEYNVTNPLLLKKIQAYFPLKKHGFSFIFSDDEKFGVFSWKTRRKEFPIKNIAFYVKGEKVTVLSLNDNPSIYYEQLDIVRHDSGVPTYILGGLKNASTEADQYCLSAYVIRQDGIEESHIFPNGESFITIRCAENTLDTCLDIERNKSLPKTMYTAIAKHSLTPEDGEYVFY